jgi:voltage-gated potassium channel
MIGAYERRTGRIARIVAMLAATLIVGTLGYHLLEDWPLVDALYMTTITLTTVGYGEVHPLDAPGRWFTMVLLLFSVGIVAYSATTLAQMVVETEFRSVFWRRRMQKRIENTRGHYIVCGYGRTGRAVCASLERHHLSYVVIEAVPALVGELKSREVLLVPGDATKDDSLHSAGIERATGLVAALGNDAENVYLVLSARQLNPRLKIVSWSDSVEAESKVRRAGANYVLSPYLLGGARMVQYLISPHTLAFIDRTMGGEYHDVHMGEIELSAGSPLIGNSLKTMGIGREIGVIVIGVTRSGGEMVFNPSADYQFREEDVVIGIGSSEQFQKFSILVRGGAA